MSSFRSSRLLLLSCLFCLVSLSFGDYIGAVVQHPTLSSPGSTPAQTKLANLNVYIEDTAVAAKAGAQIVVFPEFGLVGSEDLSKRATTVAYSEYVPDLNGTGTIVPCDDPYGFASSPALYVGSCAAKNNSIVVLINMFEQRQCGGISGCPKDGQFIHVTDVVFDETGALVAKYQKTHPFYIFSVDAPPADQPLVTYKSNFGVVFGMFICFDIAFSHPAVDLLNEGVTHFLYSAAIGKIGKMTAAKLWSLIHSATMLLANQGDDSSDIIIKGSSASTRKIPVPNTNDSIVIANIRS